jgi:radical SAM superfamily enzyme YgiQ (UPF0313 family)
MREKPKTVLVRPFLRDCFNSICTSSFEESIGLIPPLNLCCLAASVEQAGYEVLIYDGEAEGTSEDHFREYLKAEKPDIVGINMVSVNFFGALDTSRIIKDVLPDACVVCGGTHMMIFPDETLSYDSFDYGFTGEAEEPFLRFLSFLEKGSPDLSQIPGLVYRVDDRVAVNEPYGFNEDLDSLPFPAFHLLDLSKYKMPNTGDNLISLFLSRGCPFKCGFCFRGPQMQMIRFKSVDRAIEEITHVVEKYGVRSINFVDETITLNKKYFLEFAAKLKARNFDLEWQAPTRVTSLDEETVIAAKECGCHTFRLGIESGSDEILKRINKGISTSASRKAVALCRKHGIKTVGYFLIGYLGETEETIRQTIRFSKELGLDYAAFYPVTPFPETELYFESIERNLTPADYWKDFILGNRHDRIPFIFPDAGKWTAKAFRSFYFSPSYILRHMLTKKFYANFLEHCRVALLMLTQRFQEEKSEKTLQ